MKVSQLVGRRKIANVLRRTTEKQMTFKTKRPNPLVTWAHGQFRPWRLFLSMANAIATAAVPVTITFLRLKKITLCWIFVTSFFFSSSPFYEIEGFQHTHRNQWITIELTNCTFSNQRICGEMTSFTKHDQKLHAYFTSMNKNVIRFNYIKWKLWYFFFGVMKKKS